MDEKSKNFESYGEWYSIGTIEFELVNFQTPQEGDKLIAEPLLANSKKYPLINELVLIFRLPDTGLGVRTGSQKFYYLNTISLWNHPHHNAYPNPLKGLNQGQTQDYTQTSGGNVRRVKDGSTEIDLNGESGGTFEEATNIHPILPFAGDNIVEGRFGNSIRLGNTAKVSEGGIPNNWSNSGKEGMPITILKNGQPINTSGRGFEPTTENINFDFSSLYLTSTQQIPIEVSTLNKRSGEGSTIPFSGMISKTPTSPFSYNNPQIILNSGRLLFNSSTDNILFSSQKSILLDSNSDTAIRSRESNVNILTPKGNISLGGTNADEAVILGTTFIQNFDAFLGGLSTLFQALSKEAYLSVSAGFAYTLYQTQINNFRSELQNMLSEKVKVK